VQDITRPDMRARASAVYVVVGTILGGCGPLIIGTLMGSDGLATRHHGPRFAIRHALAGFVSVCYAVSALLFWAVGSRVCCQTRRGDTTTHQLIWVSVIGRS
jgi:H+/Cl- antiporter ClcA